MSGPFDFLSGIGKDISGAENSIGGWLKGLLPSQPAQPQNPPITAPSVSSTPLAGMSPAGGVSMSRPVVPQNTGKGLGFLLQHPGDFAAETGLTNLGQDLRDTDFSKTQASQDIAAPFNDPNSGISQAGQFLPGGAGMLIPGTRERMAANAGLAPNSWAGKVYRDPFGYVSNVLNAGVVAPTQLAANPEMWFAEDNNKAQWSWAGATPVPTGHNFLRDIFAPAVKAVTGEDVPPTTISFEPQAKELQVEQQQLLQAQQQLDANPNRTQQETDAFNAKLKEYQAHFDQYMTAYNKSADWWKNSNTAKTLTVLGQIATFPAGFAEGFVTFLPQLAASPEGAAEGVYAQVQQGVKFAGILINPQERDHLTAQEWASNLSNVAMLSGLFLGPKLLHKGGSADELKTQQDMLQGVVENDRSITNPEAGQVAKAAELEQARQASPPEAPEQIQTRIADLQNSLKAAQKNLQSENDPVMKRALIEQVSGLNDEINNLKAQPRQISRSTAQDFSGLIEDRLGLNQPRESEVEGPTESELQQYKTGVMDLDVVNAAYREKSQERGPSQIAPEVQPTSAREDLMGETDKILGPNYQRLQPRPEDFSLNVRRPDVSTAADFARLTPVEIRAHLADTRFKPIKVERLTGNGWVDPSGEIGIPISSYDKAAHEEFFSTAGLEGDHPEQDLMDAGWVKRSNIAGMEGFGVRGLTPRSLAIINKLIEADRGKSAQTYPYQVADELTGRPSVNVTWNDFVANHFDIAPILARAERQPRLYTSTEQGVPIVRSTGKGDKLRGGVDAETLGDPKMNKFFGDLKAIKQRLNNIGWRVLKASDVTYGWIFPDGSGINNRDSPSLAKEHSDLFSTLGLSEEGLYIRNGQREIGHNEWMNNYAGPEELYPSTVGQWIQVASPYKQPDNLYINTMGEMTDKTKSVIEDYIIKRISKGAKTFTVDLYNTDRKGVGYDPVTFTAKEFKEADFNLSNINFNRKGSPINPMLYTRQGEINGTQISEAGQAGQTSEELNRPQGTPEGTTLATTLEGTEGQGPLGVWETNPQPAGSVPDGRRLVELSKKALKDAVVESFLTSPFSRGERFAELQQTILDGIKYKIDAIPPEKIQEIIAKRNTEFQNTFNKVRGKYDPEGYVSQIYYDHISESDAYFWPNRPRGITYNPLKLITTGWAHHIADVTNKYIGELKEDLPPAQYDQLTQYIKQWTKVTQEQLDENTIAEEIAHAYDHDHLLSIDEYLTMIYHNTSEEWRQAAYRGGMGISDGGFDNSIFGWLSRWMAKPDSVPEALKQHMYTQLTEYRASSFKVWKGAPLAGYTYRVGEVFRNEIKDPSLIRPAAEALGRDFETRLRPRLRQWIESQKARNQPTYNAASQQGRPESQASTTGGAGIREGTATGDVLAPTSAASADAALGLSGRNAGDQESLGVRKPPSENKGFLSPEDFQIMQKTVTNQALDDLYKAGWPKEARWENFARTIVDPQNKAYGAVKAILDKMPPKSATVFVKAGDMLATESVKTGIKPEPRLREPAIRGTAIQEELTPEKPEVATPQEAMSPQNEFVRKEVASARVKLQESGPIIDKMVASGESLKEINTAKAQAASLRAYIDALTNGELPQRANALGRDAGAREMLRLNKIGRESPVIPELEEEPYDGVFLGKQYSGFNTDVAKKIIQRLQWKGYNVPMIKDKTGAKSAMFNDFLDGLFSQDRIAEKAFKQLEPNFQDYIKEKTGYRGVPFRGKGKQKEVAPVDDGVAPGTENYINQTDFEGMEKAIAVVPQQGGFIAIRHGSTVRNGGSGTEERLRGWDDVPLDENGEKQAERLAAAFKGMNISVIYASPLKRSLDTAYAIAKTTGAKVVIDENLKPLHIGEWANKPARDFGPRIAELARNNPDEKIPGGESWNDYIRRYLPAVKNHMMDALKQDGITLEVNHTRGVRALKGHVMAGGEGLDINFDPLSSKEEVGPGGIMGMQYENGRWTIANGTLRKKTGYNEKGEETFRSEFVSGEASQKFDVPPGSKDVMPNSKTTPSMEDPVVTAVKEDVKKTQKAGDRAAKIKGEIAPRVDLSSQIDAAAADPAHPANAAAVEAKALRDLLPRAEELGGAAYERIKSDYAVALQRFTSRMAMTAKEAPKVAELTKPNITDQKLFDHTASIAAQLRRKIDKGADLNEVAEEAAKKLGMTLKEAHSKMRDGQFGDPKVKNWADSYKDLIKGKAGQVVREARLSNRGLQPTLPISIDEFLGSQDTGKSVKPAQATTPPRPTKKVTVKAVSKVLRRSSPPRETPKEVSGDKILRDTPKKIDKDLQEHAKKDTKTLRDEVDQIHEEINTPSPSPFEANLTRQIHENMKELRKGRQQAGLEEPGMSSAGGAGGDEPPPKTPGNILAGWNNAFEPARSHGNLTDIANRMDNFLKSLSERVNPGRNTAHPSEQARQYNDHAVGDEYRRDGLAVALDKYLGQDIERHRRLRRAIEGPEDARQEAKKNLTTEEAAFADMWHSYEEVKGRIKTLPDRELIKSMAEDYLPHVLKFNERGEELLDKKGNVNATSMGSTKIKSWINRVVDEETGEVRWPTLDSLIETFGEKNVEENLVKIFKADTGAFLRKMRTKEMIDDLSGHYVSNDEGFKTGTFREGSVTPGVGGRGLRKGDPPYNGYAIVPDGKAFENMDPAYKNQLRRVNLGPTKSQLKNYWIYKPLAEQLERYAGLEEGLEGWNKATNVFQKANAVYKLYKFGFNPIHLFNLHFNMVAMGNKWDPTGLSMYSKVFRDTNALMNNEATWKTPAGEFSGDEAIAKIIDAGAVIRRELVDTASLGEFQDLFAKLPLAKQWHNFMWYETAWKMQLGLAKLKTDQLASGFERKFGRPMNEAEWNNALKLSVHNAKQAVGFLDKADMSRSWRTIAGTAYFANSWSTLQLRLLGRALPRGLPGAKWLANVGGGERYNNVISAAMKEAGMEPETLKWINSQDASMARTFAVGGALKLLAMTTALTYAGSYIATLTGQPNARQQGPYENFLRDPTHTFDIYLGTDPATGKDKWQHNPTFGMIQEMMLYGMAAIKAQREGKSADQVLAAAVGRYGFGKANPILDQVFDQINGRNNALYFLGYGERANINQDPSVVAIHKALDAKGVPDFGGLEDRLLYAWRSVGPMPSFAPTIRPTDQVNTWGDIANAMGTGQYFGAGDLWNYFDSSSPQFGQLQNISKFDLGNIAQFVAGSRQSLSATPGQVATSNQYAQTVSDRAEKDQAEQQMAQAAYKGDWQTVLKIGNQLNYDNNQMLNALEHPPTGSGGGILYHGTPYPSGSAAPSQDTLQGYTLTPGQTTELESLKKMNTIAMYNEINGSPEWQSATGSDRAAMISSMERQVMQAVENQYAQKIGLMGGAPITNDDIGQLISNEVGLRNLASGVITTNAAYASADPIQQQRMMSEYKTFADTLAWDSTFGSLKGIPPERIQSILDATIQVEEGTRDYLKGSIFYQMGTPSDQSRMLTEYSSLARIIAKRYALGQGQGPRGDVQLDPQQIMPTLQKTITIEETAKSLLHGTDYYQTADQATQISLDDKYTRLARSMAFSPVPTGDPDSVINNSLMAEESYFDLQNQFGGGNYVKLMAQQLSDLEATFRMGATYTPKQISAMQRAIRTDFLDKNPSYAAYLKAKTWWGRNTTDGQIYKAFNNSEFSAVDALDGTPPTDSILLSGTSSDPYFDPASNMSLVDLGGGQLSSAGVGLGSNPISLDQMATDNAQP